MLLYFTKLKESVPIVLKDHLPYSYNTCLVPQLHQSMEFSSMTGSPFDNIFTAVVTLEYSDIRCTSAAVTAVGCASLSLDRSKVFVDGFIMVVLFKSTSFS